MRASLPLDYATLGGNHAHTSKKFIIEVQSQIKRPYTYLLEMCSTRNHINNSISYSTYLL